MYGFLEELETHFVFTLEYITFQTDKALTSSSHFTDHGMWLKSQTFYHKHYKSFRRKHEIEKH